MVALAEWKLSDRTLALPSLEAALKVMRHTCRSLVALLWCLREELHDNRGNLRRNILETGLWRRRLSRDVAVHPLHRFVGVEWKISGEGVVERDSERVEVAARVDRTVHPPRLLRRHVGERARDEFWRCERLALTRKA